jgi:hypothetical protein
VCYLLQLITVDDSRVGYLAQILSHIEMFCFTVAWLHGFKNLLLHSLCLNDDCWFNNKLSFQVWQFGYFSAYIYVNKHHFIFDGLYCSNNDFIIILET